MKKFVTISRVLVGVLFIISGLIKANDPLGFSYKLDEYFVVFHTGFLSTISLYLAVLICVFEITLGAAILLGAKIRSTMWLSLLMILFFTFLTFYSAYFNKVTDCGCFGDAIHLTPWQSFSKDLVLLVLILVLFFHRNSIRPVMNERFVTFFVYVILLGTFYFSYSCYNHLPIKDFRPYAVGKNILEGMKLPPNAKKDSMVMTFIYEKDGKEIKLTQDDVMKMNIDSTYRFVDRKDIPVRKGDVPAIHDFSITDEDGENITEDILSNPDYNFILVAYDVKKANRKVQDRVNYFAETCQKRNISFIGLTASSTEETDLFRHEVQAMYDYYFCDATALKTMIRSNPGLVLLKNGTVIAMWHYNDFPTFAEFEKLFPNNK